MQSIVLPHVKNITQPILRMPFEYYINLPWLQKDYIRHISYWSEDMKVKTIVGGGGCLKLIIMTYPNYKKFGAFVRHVNILTIRPLANTQGWQTESLNEQKTNTLIIYNILHSETNSAIKRMHEVSFVRGWLDFHIYFFLSVFVGLEWWQWHFSHLYFVNAWPQCPQCTCTGSWQLYMIHISGQV